MSFRKVGGVQYSATQNIVKNRYNTSDNLYVTQNVGEPNTYINFLSDISGNQIYGDLVVSGDVTANEIYLTGSIVDVPNSVVPKSYVDSIGSGIHPTFACQMATASTSSPIPSLYGYLIIDGVLTQDGYRVLVNNQGYNGTSNIANISNGIYNVSSGLWSRANDCNGNNVQGQSTFIQFGNANAKSTFVQTATGASPAIAGTDPLLYQKFSTINLLLGQGLEFVSSNTIQVKSDLSNPQFITALNVSGNTTSGSLNVSGNTTSGSLTSNTIQSIASGSGGLLIQNQSGNSGDLIIDNNSAGGASDIFIRTVTNGGVISFLPDNTQTLVLDSGQVIIPNACNYSNNGTVELSGTNNTLNVTTMKEFYLVNSTDSVTITLPLNGINTTAGMRITFRRSPETADTDTIRFEVVGGAYEIVPNNSGNVDYYTTMGSGAWTSTFFSNGKYWFQAIY